jgi:osmotically-inducible protein OsmY
MQASTSKLMINILAVLASLGATGCASLGQGSNVVAATEVSIADEQLADNVRAALHADPYLYDKHVEVSIEHGEVVLRGFVSNYWDLLNAKQIAIKLAGERRVVDYLSIKPIAEENGGPRR